MSNCAISSKRTFFIVLAVAVFICVHIVFDTTFYARPFQFLRKSDFSGLDNETLPDETQRITRQRNVPATTKAPPSPRLNSITDSKYYPKLQNIYPPAVLMYQKGGIGNQLFLYACHYNIARKHNWPLYVMLPNDYGKNVQIRTWGRHEGFALDQFSIPFHEWNLAKKSWNITDAYNITDFEMLSGDYPMDKVISGSNYCQSESFFSSYRDELLDYFVQKIDLNPVKEWMDNIDEIEESVAVHVRRGDFVSGNISVPLTYHRLCMNRIVDRLKGRKVAFFVFSDDINYVKKYLFSATNDFSNRFDVHFVTDKKKTMTSLHELFLMSRCKHQIIPNSSYSWWGAYLNRNPDKIVYAAHIRSSYVRSKDKYPAASREMYVWEFRHIYYPSNWIAIEPNWNDTDVDTTKD